MLYELMLVDVPKRQSARAGLGTTAHHIYEVAYCGAV